MKTLNQLEPYQRQNLFVLFTTGLFFWTSIGILLPTLPAYLDSIGIDRQQLGLIIGSFAVGLLVTRPTLGKLADTKGRKLVLLIGTAIVTIAPYGYLTFTSIPSLMLVRVFHGISIAAFTTAYSALVVDLAPSKQRGEIIGLMSLTTPLGVAFGPAIGGYLQGFGMYRTIFWLSILVGAIAFISASRFPEPVPEIRAELLDVNVGQIDPSTATLHLGAAVPVEHTTSIWQTLTNPALSIPALILLLIGFPFGAIHTFMALYIQVSHINFNPGLFFTIAAMASFCVRAVISSKSDRYGRGMFIAAGLCCYTAGSACLATATGEMSFVCGAIFEGLGAGTLIPMTIALISDRCLPQQRGQVLSVCVTGLDLGVAIAAPLFGIVANNYGYHVIFTIGTWIAASAIVVFLMWGNANLRHSIGFCLGLDRDYYRRS